MQNIYIDSNVLITILNNESLLNKAVAILEKAANKEISLYSSMLTYGEVLYIDKKFWGKVVNFLDTIPVTYINLSKEIILSAADIRGLNNVKLPDAIHIASAKYVNSDILISQDKALLKISKNYIESIDLKDFNIKL